MADKNKEFQELKEWLIIFLKHRDIFHKKIVNINEDGEFLLVEQKDAIKYYAIFPTIGDIKQIVTEYKDKNISIITFNTRDNLDFIIKSWQELSALQMLCIYFVNPHSSTDKKWIIYPFTHSRISEKSSLKLGLMTLFESVEEYK
ncbi:MAG: hypothetical protein ABIG89_06735 [Candidatus Woesearchaeota archaeon]